MTVTRVVTRQGCTVGPQYRLLLMWACALIIATCHVTHCSTTGGKIPYILQCGEAAWFSFIVSVPRDKLCIPCMKVPDDVI